MKSDLRFRNNDDGNRLPKRRSIYLSGPSLDQNLDEIETALLEQRVGIFQRNGGLVMPGAVSIDVRSGRQIHALGLIPVMRAAALVEPITGAAIISKYDARSDEWRPVICPQPLADYYLHRRGRWKLRPLTGIANAPTLRADGSLLDKPGYDRATGLIYVPQPGVNFPPLAAELSREDASKALATLAELISKYPFIDGAARSVALAAMLTGVIRRMLPTAPGFAFDSPVPGSGKGLLCDTIAYMAHGREPSSLTQGNEEETEKRISSALIRGDSVICIDNITEPLEGAKLLSVLTQQVADLRVLGHSELVACDTRALFLFNGNNLVIPGDMCRRVLVCGIDPRCEHPERRKFKFDPLERVKRNRGRYVMAALTVLRAYRKSGAPCPAAPLGSYNEWSRWVRDALLWLGEADPVATIARSKQADPVAEQLATFMQAWSATIGEGNTVTVKAAIDAAGASGALLDAFKEVAAPLRQDAGIHVDPTRLGKWLAKHKDRVIDDRRLVRVPEKSQGNTQWRLERVSELRRAKAA